MRTPGSAGTWDNMSGTRGVAGTGWGEPQPALPPTNPPCCRSRLKENKQRLPRPGLAAPAFWADVSEGESHRDVHPGIQPPSSVFPAWSSHPWERLGSSHVADSQCHPSTSQKCSAGQWQLGKRQGEKQGRQKQGQQGWEAVLLLCNGKRCKIPSASFPSRKSAAKKLQQWDLQGESAWLRGQWKKGAFKIREQSCSLTWSRFLTSFVCNSPSPPFAVPAVW